MPPQSPSEKKSELLLYARDFPAGLLEKHIEALDSDYFNQFSVAEILEHANQIAALVPGSPLAFRISSLDPVTCAFTVVGQDFPGFFAALSGLLASHDFDITLGKVFTYANPQSNGKAGETLIIDFLILEHPQTGFLTPEFEANLRAEFTDMMEKLKAGRFSDLRADLYLRIGEYLSRKPAEQEEPRLPLEITAQADERHTILTIRGTDRKALLFTLSNALSLRGIHIHKILTRSNNGIVEDDIFITDDMHRPITDTRLLDRLKVGIILMERFMSGLPQASDYQAAIQSFNDYIDGLTERTTEVELPGYQDFTTLSTLAKILSVGTFLAGEMAKFPPDAIKTLFHTLDEGNKSPSLEEFAALLRMELAKCDDDHDSKIAAVNRFKDFQLFRLDVLHLVYPHKPQDEFSREITDLADVAISAALNLAYTKLSTEFGIPTQNGSPCPFGLFAQGKLGGRELGYASDLELQMLYESAGETHHASQSISNAEFFTRVVKELARSLSAKAEGIFELDLRLRPHGESGPLASNFAVWREYYAPGGEALDYERQALIRLRPVAVRPAGLEATEFLTRVLACRDELIYRNPPVSIENTLELRKKQLDLKADKHRINAKYAIGGLVEVEYTVQFLQLLHGEAFPGLRQAHTGKALESLMEAGLLTAGEFEILFKGYAFLRRLVDALRMVRGHSRDLWVPERNTHAFFYLAKRMGYISNENYSADAQLDWDLQKTRKDVHAIHAHRFLGGSEPASLQGCLSTVFLNPASDAEERAEALQWLGIRDTRVGNAMMLDLLSHTHDKGILCAVLVVGEAKLRNCPDSDAVLRHLVNYLEVLPDADYFVRQMLDHPSLLEVMIKIFSHSDFLTQILLLQPDYVLTLAHPGYLEKPKLAAESDQEVRDLADAPGLPEEILDRMRRYRNREYLRIGLRDIYLHLPLQNITSEISYLSNALLSHAYRLVFAMENAEELMDAMTVIALGKLGGNELNYSSDIDIVFVFDPEKANQSEREVLEKCARSLINVLSSPSVHGKMFRVDTNLRPYGNQGPITATLGHYRSYFLETAEGWEMQAWLKARPIAGNLAMGQDLVGTIQKSSVSPDNLAKIEQSMRKVRLMGLDKLRRENLLTSEVKLGPGGIRTIEFYVQYMQILHAHALPELITGNTQTALNLLYRYRLLSSNFYDLLTASYVFLRRIEHVLQLQGLLQRHVLPTSSVELEKLAKRMGFEPRLGQSAANQFMQKYRQHMLTLQELSSSFFDYKTNQPAEANTLNPNPGHPGESP